MITVTAAGETVTVGAPLLQQTFGDWPTGTPTTKLWDARMGGGGGTVNLTDTRVVDGHLRFILPANFARKGTTMFCPLARPVDEAVLGYDVRFPGWGPWGWGGKLPGLGGVAPGTTAGWPSGGVQIPPLTKGWSGRLMWVGRDPSGKSSYNTELGPRAVRGMVYTYGYDQAVKIGDNRWFTGTSDSWQPDRWHRMRIHYRLNTVGKADGLLSAQVDGATVYQTTTWQPRNTATVRITHLWMHLFQGGDASTWGLPTERAIDIDNLRITT